MGVGRSDGAASRARLTSAGGFKLRQRLPGGGLSLLQPQQQQLPPTRPSHTPAPSPSPSLSRPSPFHPNHGQHRGALPVRPRGRRAPACRCRRRPREGCRASRPSSSFELLPPPALCTTSADPPSSPSARPLCSSCSQPGPGSLPASLQRSASAPALAGVVRQAGQVAQKASSLALVRSRRPSCRP